MLDTEIAEGNQAICHWLYLLGGTTMTAGRTTAGAYGETRYLNGAEWGTNGSNIVGSNIKTIGTALTSAD